MSVGRELAVGGVDRQQLDAADPLGRTALVGVDVRGRRRDDGTPAREHGLEADDVRAGAVEDGEHGDVAAEVTSEDLVQATGVVVLAVRDLVAAVGRREGVEDLGVDAGVVVGGEAADAGVMQRVGH